MHHGLDHHIGISTGLQSFTGYTLRLGRAVPSLVLSTQRPNLTGLARASTRLLQRCRLCSAWHQLRWVGTAQDPHALYTCQVAQCMDPHPDLVPDGRCTQQQRGRDLSAGHRVDGGVPRMGPCHSFFSYLFIYPGRRTAGSSGGRIGSP